MKTIKLCMPIELLMGTSLYAKYFRYNVTFNYSAVQEFGIMVLIYRTGNRGLGL